MPFDAKNFIESSIAGIRKQVGKGKAIVAVSGGVDSTTAAALVGKAVPGQLVAIYVDTGLMRIHDEENVKKLGASTGLKVKIVDASAKYFSALRGIADPEKKRKIIGGLFIEIFEEIAKKEKVEFLVQGTIAPDWIESGGEERRTIKSHHNVGGLPEKMGLKLVEPLRDRYKHEVRAVARELGLLKEFSERQPFPGPGLGVRIVGEITTEKAQIVKKACQIVEEELEKAASEGKMELPWQYFAALLSDKTVGVKGDERTHLYTMIVRAVRSLDGMTANFSNIPYPILQKISTRITNEVKEVGRVAYDITNKPPGTIEME